MQSSGMAQFVLTSMNSYFGFPEIDNRLENELGLQEERRQDFFSFSGEIQCVQKPQNQSQGIFWGK